MISTLKQNETKSIVSVGRAETKSFASVCFGLLRLSFRTPVRKTIMAPKHKAKQELSNDFNVETKRNRPKQSFLFRSRQGVRAKQKKTPLT